LTEYRQLYPTHDLSQDFEVQMYVVIGQPTFRVEVMSFHDVLTEVADEAVHQERIPLDIRVAIPIDQGEERVGG
jgi:hypothetical protein